MRKIFDSCCGCCSLKVGVVIIGTLDLISRIFVLMSFITLRYLSPNLISVLVITILGVVLAILLLVGAFQYNKWFLLPWLIETALHCVVTIIAIALIPIFSEVATNLLLEENTTNRKSSHVLNLLGIIAIVFSMEVILFITLGMDIFLFSVVYSFYIELQHEEEQGSYDTTTNDETIKKANARWGIKR